jgi:hypothetical protein
MYTYRKHVQVERFVDVPLGGLNLHYKRLMGLIDMGIGHERCKKKNKPEEDKLGHLVLNIQQFQIE